MGVIEQEAIADLCRFGARRLAVFRSAMTVPDLARNVAFRDVLVHRCATIYDAGGFSNG